SNASSDFHERRSGIPALAFFDGVLISADYKLLKPEKEIYEALYEKFSLNPEECFFIDDVQKNIDGAKATGMDGHCYYHGDVEILKADLRSKGVNI
ncbi:MAG: HAD-IA family hydrolase, partial [Clostridia bacterium]|nr:HAD-IA family hydrolase [Clostridia bacterium]